MSDESKYPECMILHQLFNNWINNGVSMCNERKYPECLIIFPEQARYVKKTLVNYRSINRTLAEGYAIGVDEPRYIVEPATRQQYETFIKKHPEIIEQRMPGVIVGAKPHKVEGCHSVEWRHIHYDVDWNLAENTGVALVRNEDRSIVKRRIKEMNERFPNLEFFMYKPEWVKSSVPAFKLRNRTKKAKAEYAEARTLCNKFFNEVQLF